MKCNVFNYILHVVSRIGKVPHFWDKCVGLSLCSRIVEPPRRALNVGAVRRRRVGSLRGNRSPFGIHPKSNGCGRLRIRGCRPRFTRCRQLLHRIVSQYESLSRQYVVSTCHSILIDVLI